MSLLLDLEADTLSLSDGDPVSTWADQSGNGRDFTQSGDARPTKQTVSGYPALFFNSPNNEPQWLDGPNFADNLSSFTMISVLAVDPNSNNDIVICKIKSILPDGYYDKGWVMPDLQPGIIERGTPPAIRCTANSTLSGGYDGVKHVFTGELVSLSEMHVYYNSGSGETNQSSGVTDYSNSLNVTIGAETLADVPIYYIYGYVYAIRIYSPVLSVTDRVTAEAELGGRYGVEGYPPIDVSISINPNNSAYRAKGVRIYP